MPGDTASRLEETLRRFDEETTSQVVVAVFPELPSPSLEDFTVRTAQAWRAGRKKLDNGVVLFVFVKDRAVRIEVGYGLEGALPDATANRIIEDEIVPRFRTGDYGGGLEAGVAAILAATRGEYRASPGAGGARGVTGPRQVDSSWIVVALFVFVFFILPLFRQRGRTYSRRGWYGGGPWWWGGGGGGFGGGGFGGGGFGGGGFSGGGGGFGGGGASGRW